MSNLQAIPEAHAAPIVPDADTVIELMLARLSDGLDQPELWAEMAEIVTAVRGLRAHLAAWFQQKRAGGSELVLLHAMVLAASGDLASALGDLQQLATMHSQSALVQGALFHVQGLADPENPKYRLTGKICGAPFEQLDVLENSTHQCCASWLHASAGNLMTTPWQQVWNSQTAQAVRASVLDGSYRYCNKSACPRIQANTLDDAGDLAAHNAFWADVIANARTAMPTGPRVVNLAYDRTCNLSCPSCRSERFAADDATRARFARLQDEQILPLLAEAEVVFITGSGDPFASKNFRQLLTDLTPEAYPKLRFQVMTNGMLFTPRQWAEFPTLHSRVAKLKVSIDAATGPTHELLRRGARWPVMLENMRFAGDLLAQGLISEFELVFVVQAENYREMGDAVDLAKAMGASGIYFCRLTNWGTFSNEEFANKAVCAPSHPEHAAFLAAMHDPRLMEPMVLLGDLEAFLPAREEPRRAYAR